MVKHIYDTDNLYNCSFHKTRRVMEYIKGLDIDVKWSIYKRHVFMERIHKALKENSATAMLDSIGYEYHGLPKLYSEITNLGDG
jgi:hypothetical protein